MRVSPGFIDGSQRWLLETREGRQERGEEQIEESHSHFNHDSMCSIPSVHLQNLPSLHTEVLPPFNTNSLPCPAPGTNILLLFSVVLTPCGL